MKTKTSMKLSNPRVTDQQKFKQVFIFRIYDYELLICEEIDRDWTGPQRTESGAANQVIFSEVKGSGKASGRRER
ncbi:hypothetical protein ACFX12_032920 [Malus domestica]